ncbi:amidohydrolase family protein [Bosea sp. NPDC003192]|jgi:predicted TIM-barrel fold metal-dependent hydrolase|uniref:amidohydrolase family protein n=1 Tax=Bosea sp. NPDC003192 TaxID=3390551 RepID=UPI003D056C81
MSETAVPPGACDCHVHLFGPPERFPFAADRIYTPGNAGEKALLTLHERLGMSRVVLVQPSPYGTDNSRLLSGLAELGSRARAVAVVERDASSVLLQGLSKAGVRGLRLNVDTQGVVDPETIWTSLHAEAIRCARLGWHVQILTRLSVIAALGDRLATLPAPLVIDHFGRPDLDQGIDQPSFAALLRLVRSGTVWVKLSSIGRLCGAQQDRIAPFVRDLVEARADRMVWGSDWPHTGGGRGGRPAGEIEPFAEVDDAESLAVLMRTVGDAGTLRRILVDNPAWLYGFEA